MEDCIFCKIVKKEIPSYVVYENNDVIAFMNIRAVNEGHLLVIPKVHIPYLIEMNDEIYIKVMLTVKKLSVAIDKTYKPEKVGLMITGWDVPHIHVHVLPLYETGDISSKKILENTVLQPSDDELKSQSAKIRALL